MAFNWKLIRKKTYGIVKAPGRQLVKLAMYDEKGNETIEPTSANRFFATFSSNNKELDDFTVLVAIRDEGQSSHIDIKTPALEDDTDFDLIKSMIEHIRKAIGQREGIKVNWQDFDKAIDPREEAVNNIKESKDVGKIFGTTKSSFQKIGNAKLIIRHTDTINEEKHGARTRHVRALFVENQLGERFSYPHVHLTGARAFARHISNGGTNHDEISKKIFSLSEDYISLRRSKHHLRLLENRTGWMMPISAGMEGINRRLKSMCGPKGYALATQTLLDESVVVDVAAIDRLHIELVEACDCEEHSQLYGDLKKAAGYMIQYPRSEIEQPSFGWNRRPNLSVSTGNSANDRIYQQIAELADACSNEQLSKKLKEISRVVAAGNFPSNGDIDLVKEAMASGLQYRPVTDSGLQEEAELDQFLSEFTVESMFSEERPPYDERFKSVPRDVPGEIFDRIGNVVLMHDWDSYGDVVKHSYDIYQIDGNTWTQIDTINEPYDRRGNEALAIFRQKYGQSSTNEPTIEASGLPDSKLFELSRLKNLAGL